MDRIEIRGLRVFAHHGVLPTERERGQTFVIDVTAELDLEAAGRSDDLARTLDYDMLCTTLATVATETRFELIEALADRLASEVLAHRTVQAVEVRVAKPQAPVRVDVGEVAVAIRRSA